ncbi:cation:proton antiporter [Xanthocytophaga agilis]|uniref:Cation:proton antiporter n=1 Tax=Xanthocytophaga agilis TaxID=3048010 RepID=A0AAE3QY31_9BACT|nr:cation:proton antiporter [Xanthocytophaga agilis]MDJ1500144.1 cation:proton antiporter [Xanthocytophaga agilis]
MNAYWLILTLGFCVILSYLYSFISKATRIPSVLLLLITGIGVRLVFGPELIRISFVNKIVEVLGIIGLIVIVLEAALDLKISPEKVTVVRNSFLAAVLVFFLSVLGITAVLQFFLERSLIKCIVYAIPLSIISSAIIIPSIEHLSEQKKEFIIYEASFSDIIGILVFNYLTAEAAFSISSIILFGFSIVWAIILSLMISLALSYLLSRIRSHVKFVPILTILLMLYAMGKLLHLPALLIIMVFGLLVNNKERISLSWVMNVLKTNDSTDNQYFEELLKQLKSITYETSFIVRTFFFILFGYSIDIQVLTEWEVILIGSSIVGMLLLLRYLYLRYFLRAHVLPELFLMPRGLITVLLFYSIPQRLQLGSFNNGILFFVILTTSVLMMLGLLLYRADVINLSDGEQPL